MVSPDTKKVLDLNQAQTLSLWSLHAGFMSLLVLAYCTDFLSQSNKQSMALNFIYSDIR